MSNEIDDIIAGSRLSAAWPDAYVLGTLDDRITLHAQQIRAMNLASALAAGGELPEGRILVVGAGAAGLTLAASLALLSPEHEVAIYELAPEPVHLQSACSIRNLHPHIYDWPHEGARKAVTDLPFLNWRAGSAKEVAGQLTTSFAAIRDRINGRTGSRLTLDTNVLVKRIHRSDSEFLVDCNWPDRPASKNFSSVFLTVGFGEERGVPGIAPHSYWFDGSVPAPFLMGKPSTKVIVSGNGDGGLIDLAAVALESFDHTDLIRAVTNATPSALRRKLIELEKGIYASGTQDIFELYNSNEILQDAKICDVFYDIEKKIISRRNVIFHTKDAFILNRRSSILNRFIAYLLLNAEPKSANRIQHLYGPLEVVSGAEGRYRIGGQTIDADSVVVRHGADRVEPLRRLLGGRVADSYATTHRRWLAENMRRGRPPQIPDWAQESLDRAAARVDLGVERRYLHSPSTSESAHRPPGSGACLRLCVAAAGMPPPPPLRPLNLVMALTVRRAPAIFITVGVDPQVLDGALQCAQAIARDVNARAPRRTAAPGNLELPTRTWAVSERPAWPEADGSRGLVWSPKEATPSPADVAEALRGAQWADAGQPGDLLVVALPTDDDAAALALAGAIGGPAADRHRQMATEIPVYAWSRVGQSGATTEAKLKALGDLRPALARLRRCLDETDASVDVSSAVEDAREMRLFAGGGASPAWRKASREAIELHDLSLLMQRDGGVERPPSSEGQIAAALVDMAADNEAILATLAFLPVATPVLERLLRPANSLARLVLGLADPGEMRRERTIGNWGRVSGAPPAPVARFRAIPAKEGNDG